MSGVVDRIIGGWQFQGLGRIQSGRMPDFGNVRLVGFTKDEIKNLFQLRMAPDATGKTRVWMMPQDIIDNTVKAFNVSATSPTGYGPLGPPSGRYFAPANGPDCIEVAAGTGMNTGYGDCGARSVVVNGPAFIRFDMSLTKQTRIKGRTNFEFRFDVFNVFNRVNFTPVTWTTGTTGGTANPAIQDTYEVTALADIARQVLLVFRFNW